jgi:hypothetical protein
MAKTSGRNASILVNGYDLTIYGRKYDISDGVNPVDVTGFTQPLNYVPGSRTSKMSIEMMWDSAAGKSVPVLKVPGTGYITIAPEGLGTTTPGNESISLEYMQSNFSPAAGVADEVLTLGSIEFDAYGTANGGIEKGQIVYSGEIQATTTGASTPVDNAGQVVAACSGTLHVTKATSDSYAVVVQHSATGTSAWAPLVTFTLPGTAIGAEKISVASGTVNPYRRVVATRTGAVADAFGFTVHFVHD